MTTATPGSSGGARRTGPSRADLAKDRKFLTAGGPAKG
ncbi:MAG: hypothetical protein QOE30_4170, partial [Mycobacterium sp.]|nr:hypothetical protein [Mycobacterium sp.]